MTWQLARICPEGTHHEIAGVPLYAERFDHVGKYHPPGLAPVRRDGEAWHIDENGRAAYARRYRQTFGFYEGRAAVDDGEGWLHVDVEGRSLEGSGRHAWCGNFQEGRAPVRGFDHYYHHVDLDGRPVYDRRWHYAGDFRDGIAVVQAEDGRSTHVDRSGALLHDCWFDDLDVFHKGLARARDRKGWMHVDARGRPRYARRFTAVEPFYNGQARVETFEGGLQVIDEDGSTLVELRPSSNSAFMQLSSDLVGYWRTHAIATAVEIGLFDRLPGDESSLAAACGVPVERMLRLLRALGELELVELADGIWTARDKASPLRRAHPTSLADAALEYAGPLGAVWHSLPEALRGSSSWQSPRLFDSLANSRAALERHHRALLGYARHDYATLVDALPTSAGQRVIDAGGGSGGLADLLLDRRPDLEVVLLDRPEVLSLRESERSGLVRHPADLFTDWRIQGDLVILARVLHDWDDEHALAILTRAKAALRPTGRLVVVELLLSDPASGDYGGGLCDLHLLVCHGGLERDLRQWTELLARAGFVLEYVQSLNSVPSMMVAGRA
jgi:hypothetical protein